MRGLAGVFRWDGGPVAGGFAPTPAADAMRQWQSPDGGLWLAAWGAEHRGTFTGWCVDAEAGLVLVADASLYDRDGLQSALGLAGPVLDAPTLLLRGYQRWGEGLPQRLDGDFAFVVCDLRKRCVFAASDPMGMRPLFHRLLPGGGFAFATAPEALAACTGLDARIPESRLLEPLFNAEQLAHFEPEIAGIQRLLAAQWLRADARDVQVQRYWTPGQTRPALATADMDGWVEALRWHLGEAVRKRLADGVRAGVMFSGGLDSSAVLALGCGYVSAGRLQAYSVLDRGNPACPETRAIDRVLAATGVPATCIDVADMQAQAAGALDALAASPRFVSGRNGFLPLFDRMAAASGVDVMMNGVDADALFFYEDLLERQIRAGGYAVALRCARKQDRMAGEAWMVPLVRRLRYTAHLPPVVRNGVRRWRGRASEWPRLHAALLRTDACEALGLRARARRHLALLRRPPPPAGGLPTQTLHGAVNLDGIGRFHARSRHFGVEMRCPFLDRALIDFAAWIPLELRLRNGHLKWILRKALTPHLPHAVAWRGDKFHPGSHFDRVMLQPVLEQVVRDFHGSGPAIGRWIDRERFLAAAQRWQAGQIEAVWELKMLLLLEHWLQHNADKVAFGR